MLLNCCPPGPQFKFLIFRQPASAKLVVCKSNGQLFLDHKLLYELIVVGLLTVSLKQTLCIYHLFMAMQPIILSTLRKEALVKGSMLNFYAFLPTEDNSEFPL